METTREQFFLLITTPFYAIVIGAEMVLSSFHNKNWYTKRGTFYNFYLMLLNFGLDLLMLAICLQLLSFVGSYKLFSIHNIYVYWIVLLIMEDLMFYFLHYIDHYVRFFWAVHVTHHSSNEFNLTVGFRSSVFQPLYRMFYFIPIALCGFKPIDIMFMYSATQIYGILIHTQYINKLGFFEWFMATPSHHRVHHASNPQYLDKNLGMIFIVWDKLFGTFREEKKDEPVKYGLTKNIIDPNPATIVFHEWMEIWKDIHKPVSFRSKLMYLFGPPGWSHDGSRKTSKQLEEGYYMSVNMKG